MTQESTQAPARHTIYEVAHAAGVSIATVSRALSKPEVVSPGTRERVRAAIERLNYVPDGAARALAARQNEAYALMLPELSGPYYAELLSGFEAAAAETGASVMVTLTKDKGDLDGIARRLAGRVDALAIMGNVHVSQTTLDAIRRKIPVVTFAGNSHGGVESLSTENHASARELTAHLLDQHHRSRLLFLGDPSLAPDIRERHEGFVAAHDERGLACADPIACAPLEAEGEHIGSLVATGDLQTDGLVCANDELALAVQRRLLQDGIDVPRQISVTGWDDMLAARYVTPALTTVRQPVRELGRRVIERIQHLRGNSPNEGHPRRLPTSVVLRQSCGCT
ncbi:MAG: LacI family DNA-binding transcriptional regulator [Tessaracoccus sp.]|uniref:LacI family DNA-binding transcriptional regulator n=1 Tax=Tessaracoccus sp. TaxID=1971211 RepID=UPI001ED34CEB|nr:LacI family DNA-binding transcriptional regulator [Tessaracoccus sp.]MBK7819570.1 LacI family DNA-binding transcriptional regulator [Tessaracoccus sp.]